MPGSWPQPSRRSSSDEPGCRRRYPPRPADSENPFIRRLVLPPRSSYGRPQGRYLVFYLVVGMVSRVPKRIRVTGKRRATIDTDRLAALLLRAARRAQDAADTATADAGHPDQEAASGNDDRITRGAA
jgi:hypothetical protein